MEKLISSWNNVQAVPEKFIFPPERRPGNNITFSATKSIPIIDLGETASSQDRQATIQKILKAGHEYGFFQLINHGVEEDLMKDTLNVIEEFLKLPAEDKRSFFSENPWEVEYIGLYPSSFSTPNAEVHLWRDNIRMICRHPLENSIQHWPDNPTRFRRVVGAYAAQVKKLGSTILELIGEGLGLEAGYFGGELSENAVMKVNHYPPCPDPSLTFGVSAHCDPNLITILQQGDVFGLQVLRDGEWIGVEPVPNAFVVNLGYQMQIISNDMLRSVEHRAVTNSTTGRTTIGFFIIPKVDSVIEPAKAHVNSSNSPAVYRSFLFKEFIQSYMNQMGDNNVALEPFKLPAS